MIRRWADPLLVVEACGRLTLCFGVSRPRKTTAVPTVNCPEITDRPIEDEFTNPFEIRIRVALSSVLRSKLVAVLQIICANNARLFDGDAERLLAINVHPAVHRPVRDKGVMVVCSADDDRFHILLIEQAPPVGIRLRLRKDLERFFGTEVVDVAERDHVLVSHHIVVSRTSTPYTDEGDVQLVTR